MYEASRGFIQIVPALPPMASGVGDYAMALACRLRTDFGAESLFVVANEQCQPGSAYVKEFRVQGLRERSAQRLMETLCDATAETGEASVLLHLSGYGYSHRGCPFWLLDGLKRWRQQQRNAHLVTMFHELYAPAPVWTHMYWISLAQKSVAARIARLSDVAVTNIDRHRARLERCDPRKAGKIAVLGVPSNVGEPVAPGELRSRAKALVVFGLAASRKRAYQSRMAELQTACALLQITEVHDVGPALDAVPERIGRAPVRRHGRLAAAELSALLSQSMAGFVDYTPAFLAKSGVFAAYCAHRMLPVVPEQKSPDLDGLCRGANYYTVKPRIPSARCGDAQAIADAAWRWYQSHSLLSHARVFASAFGDAAPAQRVAHSLTRTGTR